MNFARAARARVEGRGRRVVSLALPGWQALGVLAAAPPWSTRRKGLPRAAAPHRVTPVGTTRDPPIVLTVDLAPATVRAHRVFLPRSAHDCF